MTPQRARRHSAARPPASEIDAHVDLRLHNAFADSVASRRLSRVPFAATHAVKMDLAWLDMPTNPVRQFQLLYCLWLSLAMLRNGRQHYRFYRWFYSSDLGLATKRGLGAHPSRIYGIFTPPILSPAQLAAAGVAFTACLLAACLPLAPRVFLFLAYLLYFLYFPQMFAEATLSGHGSILIPSMLFLLACSPSLDHEVQSRSEWPLTLIRIYLASGYFSSGMCKLLCGARFGKFWGMGPTLQYYIFDALWSRPAGPTVRRIQETAITAPRIMTFLATSSMFFEIGFISAPFSDMMSVFFGLNGLAFHAGIMLFQVLPPAADAIAPAAAAHRTAHRSPSTSRLARRASTSARGGRRRCSRSSSACRRRSRGARSSTAGSWSRTSSCPRRSTRRCRC